jgi:F-type H+-transporting ATPase subunit h
MQLRRPPAEVTQSPTLCHSRPPLMPLVTDLIQDLYLKELKTYKAPLVVSRAVCIHLSSPRSLGWWGKQAKDAHVGVVKAFSAPALPSPPALPDLATELVAYDATEPTRAPAADVPAGNHQIHPPTDACLRHGPAVVPTGPHDAFSTTTG